MITDTLWSGGELSSDAVAHLFPKGKNKEAISMPSAAVEKLVLMGPMDSGTHLMSWLLTQNYAGHMDAACGMTFQGCRYLWKHSADIPGVYRVLQGSVGQDLSNTVVVAMVRSPIAQIVGWRKDPWDLRQCVDRPWGKMADTCEARITATLPEEHEGLAKVDSPTMRFLSTMGVYNQYIKLYKTLKSDGRFRDVLIVPYEDLVLTPKAVLYQVAQALDWEPSWDTTLPQGHEGGMKGAHGLSRWDAVMRIQSRDFVDEADGGLPLLCKHLNLTLIRGLKEGTYVDNNPDLDASMVREYDFDCNGLPTLEG